VLEILTFSKQNLIEKQLCEEEFAELIKDYLEYDVIKQMDEHIHHGTTTTLQHCENVAWICYLLNKKLNLNANERNWWKWQCFMICFSTTGTTVIQREGYMALFTLTLHAITQ